MATKTKYSTPTEINLHNLEPGMEVNVDELLQRRMRGCPCVITKVKEHEIHAMDSTGTKRVFDKSIFRFTKPITAVTRTERKPNENCESKS